MQGLKAVLVSQRTGQLETDHGAHAVTEESKRLNQIRQQRRLDHLDQGEEIGYGRLTQTATVSRQLHRANVNPFGELLRPLVKDSRTPTGVWKTKQTNRRFRSWLRVNQPRIAYFYSHTTHNFFSATSLRPLRLCGEKNN